MRFQLRTVLLFMAMLPLFVGVHVILDVLTVGLWIQLLDGIRRINQYLLDAGLPPTFVTGYITHILHDVVLWACLAAIAFVAGLLRSRRAHRLFGAFVLSYLLYQLIWHVQFYVPLSGLAIGLRLFLLSLGGIPIMAAAWFIGWKMRGRGYEQARQLPRWLRIGLCVVATILLLGLSAIGWSILASPNPWSMGDAGHAVQPLPG